MLAVAFLSTSPSDSALGQWSFRSWTGKMSKHGELVPVPTPSSVGAGALFPCMLPETAMGGLSPAWGASALLPWTDPSSAWPLSAASALSLGGEESGQCCGVLWQGGCCVHLLCLRMAAPLTASVTSCRVLRSEALQTILPLPGGIAGMGCSISMEWQLLSARRQGEDERPILMLLCCLSKREEALWK